MPAQDFCAPLRTENRWLRRGLVFNVAVSIAASLATLVGFMGVRPKPIVEPKLSIFSAPDRGKNAAPAQAVAGEPPVVRAFGWVPQTDVEEEEALDPARTLHFDQTPAGKAAKDGFQGAQAAPEDDVFLWRALRMALNLPDNRYPNVNQESVGCCVGCGWKHCLDIVQGVQITTGARADEVQLISVESIYGPSRVEVGGNKIRGDGSSGSWANRAVKSLGVLAMKAYPDGTDLTTFSPSRARQWGRSGMPDALEPTAAQNRVTTTALVKTWTDLEGAIRQGYPVAICSDCGFEGMHRDADGFVRRSGVWQHCMAVVGVRGGARPGAFILNSWGDSAHRGPVYPADAPVAGFWADKVTVEYIVRQAESYAVADLNGFPARKLNWFIGAPPVRPAFDLMAARQFRPLGAF